MARKSKRLSRSAARAKRRRKQREARKAFQSDPQHSIEGIMKKSQERSDGLKRLKSAWKAYNPDDMAGGYGRACRAVRFIRYSSSDVERFSLALGKMGNGPGFSWRAGYFLSAMINYCRDDDITVHTKNLREKIDFFGYKNIKDVTVRGDLGSKVGQRMKRGSIHVHGDAKTWVGDGMRGGSITVEGDSVSDVGIYMRGGSITIKGDAGSRIGCHMSGGSVEVEGNARDVGLAMEGGRITVKTHADLIGQGMRGGQIHLEGTYGKIGDVVFGTIFHKSQPLNESDFKDRVFYWIRQYLKTFKLLVTSPIFTIKYVATLSFTVISWPYRFARRKLLTAGDYAKAKLARGDVEIDDDS